MIDPRLLAVDIDGAVAPGFPIVLQAASEGITPSLVDVDGDGLLDAALSTGALEVHALAAPHDPRRLVWPTLNATYDRSSRYRAPAGGGGGPVEAEVDFRRPRGRRGCGRWVDAFIELEDEATALALDLASIAIVRAGEDDIEPVLPDHAGDEGLTDRDRDGRPEVVLVFRRSELLQLAAGRRRGRCRGVELGITGAFADGRELVGSGFFRP